MFAVYYVEHASFGCGDGVTFHIRWNSQGMVVNLDYNPDPDATENLLIKKYTSACSSDDVNYVDGVQDELLDAIVGTEPPPLMTSPRLRPHPSPIFVHKFFCENTHSDWSQCMASWRFFLKDHAVLRITLLFAYFKSESVRIEHSGRLAGAVKRSEKGGLAVSISSLQFGDVPLMKINCICTRKENLPAGGPDSASQRVADVVDDGLHCWRRT